MYLIAYFYIILYLQNFHADYDYEYIAGHLVEYPINVDQEGEVSAMEDCTNFPDTMAPIQGAKSAHLPNKLTT